MDEDLLTDEQYVCFDMFKNGQNIFITGPGGVGKSFLIQMFLSYCKLSNRNIQVCALTACAALLLGQKAKTIHSWSGLGYCEGDLNTIIKKAKQSRQAKRNWKKVKTLIIDEVSMMNCTMLIALEKLARDIRGSTDIFGGIQVIFCGDFYQLPPITKYGEKMTFCFEDPLWKKIFPYDQQIKLSTIFRQKDKDYLGILSEVREGIISDKNLELLRSRIVDSIPESVTQIYPKRHSVDSMNKIKFDELETPIYNFKMTIHTESTHYCKTMKPIEQEMSSKYNRLNAESKKRELNSLIKLSRCISELSLKVGSLVMFIANISIENGIVNGTQGIIYDFIGENNQPRIKLTNGEIRRIPIHSWQSEEYPNIIIKQYPVVLAWATTIHKIQGSSLDSAIMDLGNNIFEAGQIYVALSRVRSLQGLYLINFNPNLITTNKKVIKFYKSIPEIEVEVEVEEEIIDNKTIQEAKVNKDNNVQNSSVCNSPKIIMNKSNYADNKLYIKLKEYRLEKSRQHKIAPYCIFNNRSLEELTEKHPKTMNLLEFIHGFGDSRIQKYGKDIIDICTQIESN